MTAWTDEQRRAIFEDYWRTGSGRCPTDDSILDFSFAEFLGGTYQLTARCPRDGNMAKFSRDDDPLREQFRQWTDDEKGQLVDGYFQRRHGTCPVCRTAVQMKPSGGVSETVLLNCRRCGNFRVYTPAHGR